MENSPSNKRYKIISNPAVCAIIVAAVAAVLYFPTLRADFVFDDTSQILSDNYIHNPANFIDVLTLSSMKKDIIDNNRPVMLLSLMLDAMLWKYNPLGYHLTNLLLHCLCSFLFFWVTYKILLRLYPQSSKSIGPLWAALSAALLFAIHPVNSEAVCVITFREDLLAAFFTLFVLFLADGFPTQKISSNLIISSIIVICIFAAAAAKENGVVASVLLVLYWLVVRRHTQWRPWSVLIFAGLAATGAFIFARFTLVPSQSVIAIRKAVYIGGSFWAMLAVEPRIMAFQLLEFIWPKLLCANYSYSSISFITLPAALAVLAVLIVIAVIHSRKNAGFAFGVMFYVLAILPTSNIVPIFIQIADRYLYLPTAGLCITLAALLCRLKMPAGKLILAPILIFAGVCVFLGSFTIQRMHTWHDRLSLWQDTIAKNPYSYAGHNNLGFTLYAMGEYNQAIISFTRASDIEPNYAEPYVGLALTYDATGQTARADEALRMAISLNKAYASYDSLMQTHMWDSYLAKKIQVIADRIKQP
jgi:protein O-mannosyl-transferase